MLVQLIAHTNDPEKTIAAAAKLCYSDAHIETLLDGLTPEKTEAFLQRLNDVGHASPIEHASFTFGIEGVSRTFLAQVFAQNPQILILDEPANHLDLIYQKHIFSLIETWLRQPGRAVVSVVHDLSLARKYGTHAVLMHRGQCAAQGKIGDVMTAEKLQAVYEMDVYGWMREMLGQWA